MDVACAHMSFELFCDPDLCSCNLTNTGVAERDIYQSKIVQAPEDSYDPCRSLWLEDKGIPRQGRIGDLGVL